MAKNKDVASAELVKIKLNCIYSGFADDPGPGSVIEVDEAEAARLIEIGVAEKAAEEAAGSK